MGANRSETKPEDHICVRSDVEFIYIARYHETHSQLSLEFAFPLARFCPCAHVNSCARVSIVSTAARITGPIDDNAQLIALILTHSRHCGP